ncbi:MAG: sortase [Candidatus Pacebacteria bacterium]|nr:sortase [Candidatus Paceibacterota bacterium]MBT3511543.1 sortase [Candidatus Paceibacterota bacterium]MBT4004987.1 sortase [Candidatus Paceibacterota bacterium]MBT4358763.1 sortase [Candidatus Paceibacterota bacterium]MBT4680571.1 sortase [Candidatus Paceibacterota bacterium]
MKQINQISSAKLVDLYRQALKKNLSLNKLEKKISKKLDKVSVSQKVEQKEERERVSKIRHRLPKTIRYGALVLPMVFIGVGLFLLGNAIAPLAQYYFSSLPNLSENQLKAPIPKEDVLDVTPLVISQVEHGSAVLGSKSKTTGPVILDTELDYTNLTNWFNDGRSDALRKIQNNTMYVLSIPELEIEDAHVQIGGMNLDESLIAYPGTAFPGELGSPVIFGHSVLRQFYNPSEKNPRRYNSIFSYIMTLEKGAEIFLTQDGAKYKYRVTDKTDVKPEDTYILAQQYDDRKLKLVTCVPEGTYLRRGVVTAELVNN